MSNLVVKGWITKEDLSFISDVLELPKNFRLYNSNELHHEFGDNPEEYVVQVTITIEAK
jgi:hypothetical protein